MASIRRRQLRHSTTNLTHQCLLVLGFTCLLLLQMSSSLCTTRTILITGATDGIGQHTAKKLAADGNVLIVQGRRPDAGEKLVRELKDRGAQDASYFNADLADLDQVRGMAEAIKKKFDSIDVLINNAGVFDPTAAHSAQGYDTTWAVNVMAPFLLTRRLLALVANSQDDCPRIITTSSISQSSTLPNMDQLFEKNGMPQSAHRAYSDSKLGDLMMTVKLAKILNSMDRKWNKIKCLTMDPGTVNTKMLLAGWGACGINVRNADNTYKLATDYGAQQKSGSYHFGGSGGRRSTEELELFWKMLEKHTDCTYSDIETQG